MNILPTGLNLGQQLQGALFPQPLAGAKRADDAREQLSQSPEAVEPFPQGSGGARYLQAQILSIEIEFQSTRRLQLDNGETVVERTRINFRAVGAYAESGRFDPAKEPGLDSLRRGRFSPENVARRIVDFALDRFDLDPDDTVERASFIARAKTAIRSGVDQALGKLSGLPEGIRELGEEIFQLAERLLDQFGESGERVSEDQPSPQVAQPAALQNRAPEARVQFSEVSFGVTVERTRVVDLVA